MLEVVAYAQVAVPVPLRTTFVYHPPKGCKPDQTPVGVRMRVPFGRRQIVGVLCEWVTKTDVPKHQIKTAIEVLDQQAILTEAILRLCQWISNYYHYPIGEVISCALPRLLRLGGSTEAVRDQGLQITEKAEALDLSEVNRRAPRQAALLQYLLAVGGWAAPQQLAQAGFSSSLRKSLLEKQWLNLVAMPEADQQASSENKPPALQLTQHQAAAVQAINNHEGFQVFLLDGVTGSGKTEVYLRVIAEVLQKGKQALLLVPEIGLTPQMVQRVRTRFANDRVVVLHSGLTDRERHHSWLNAWRGKVDIVIGTRSAVFVPLKALAVIIIDEEHDTAYSQLSGCRYSARDVAVIRAKHASIPIILGSATPSLESWHNVKINRYQRLVLPQRAGDAKLPTFYLLDLSGRKLWNGLSPQLLQAIDQHLKAGQQVLLFLNRRGFAPVLLCHHCGWYAQCQHCDARMTLHYQPQRLYCHHCGASQVVPQQCPTCNEMPLVQVGMGTERLEQAFMQRYPNLPITRIDRDTVRGGREFSQLLEKINQPRSQLLIGTQMLAKGHHFPQVTLVGIVDVDYGLCSADFRALERMSQLILQVAGRAGRGELRGEVYLQTHYPQNPMLQTLLAQGYHILIEQLWLERQRAQLPPLAYLALWRIEAKNKSKSEHAAEILADFIKQRLIDKVSCIGPMPAVMMKRANAYRMQLWLCSPKRRDLHQLINRILCDWPQLKGVSAVHFSLDVDPVSWE